MGIFTTSAYDEFVTLVDESTSEFIPAAQENLALNLEITDLVKSKSISPKDAMRYLKGRLQHSNPNVQLLTLQLIDKCIKNGGKHFLVEVAGREFVDELVTIMVAGEDSLAYVNDDSDYDDGINPDDPFAFALRNRQPVNDVVRTRLLDLFQTWALLLQADSDLAYLVDTYRDLQRRRLVSFPSPALSIDHLDPTSIVNTAAPPDWTDSPACQRCRAAFTLTNRKHHCRKCGGTFCQLCSGRSVPLLELGITEAVRVCDGCWSAKESADKRPARLSELRSKKPVNEDEDLKRAIEISLAEQQQQSQALRTPSPRTREEEQQLRAAIEASLADTNSASITIATATATAAPSRPDSPTHSLFSSLELDNISLFHALINRLLGTRPQIPADDARDLGNLAREMRALQRRLKSFERTHGLMGSQRLISVAAQLTNSLEGFQQLGLEPSKQGHSSTAQVSQLESTSLSIPAEMPATAAAVTSVTRPDVSRNSASVPSAPPMVPEIMSPLPVQLRQSQIDRPSQHLLGPIQTATHVLANSSDSSLSFSKASLSLQPPGNQCPTCRAHCHCCQPRLMACDSQLGHRHDHSSLSTALNQTSSSSALPSVIVLPGSNQTAVIPPGATIIPVFIPAGASGIASIGSAEQRASVALEPSSKSSPSKRSKSRRDRKSKKEPEDNDPYESKPDPKTEAEPKPQLNLIDL